MPRGLDSQRMREGGKAVRQAEEQLAACRSEEYSESGKDSAQLNAINGETINCIMLI